MNEGGTRAMELATQTRKYAKIETHFQSGGDDDSTHDGRDGRGLEEQR